MSDTDPKFSKRAWMSLKHSPLADVIKFLVVIGLIIWLMGYGTGSLTYNWQWYRIPQYIFSFENGRFITGPLLDGLVVTFQITGVSLILAFLLGLVTAFFRLSNSFLARALARDNIIAVRSVAQPGSALAWGARGHRFKSGRSDQLVVLQIAPTAQG